MRVLVLASLLVSLVGCASYFKRKDCEAKNWFQHGYDVAMRGQRLDQDDLIRSCKKVEAEFSEAELDRGFKAGMAKYCSPQIAFDVGRSGEFFNLEMCSNSLQLRKKHEQGVELFCQPDAAFAAGAKGWKYNNVCAQHDEKSFLVKYKAGRKTYLSGQIKDKEQRVLDIDRSVHESERRRSSLNQQLAALPRTQVLSRERVYDPVAKKFREETKLTEDPAIRDERDSVVRSLRALDTQINEYRDQQMKLREEINQLNTEFRALE